MSWGPRAQANYRGLKIARRAMMRESRKRQHASIPPPRGRPSSRPASPYPAVRPVPPAPTVAQPPLQPEQDVDWEQKVDRDARYWTGSCRVFFVTVIAGLSVLLFMPMASAIVPFCITFCTLAVVECLLCVTYRVHLRHSVSRYESIGRYQPEPDAEPDFQIERDVIFPGAVTRAEDPRAPVPSVQVQSIQAPAVPSPVIARLHQAEKQLQSIQKRPVPVPAQRPLPPLASCKHGEEERLEQELKWRLDAKHGKHVTEEEKQQAQRLEDEKNAREREIAQRNNRIIAAKQIAAEQQRASEQQELEALSAEIAQLWSQKKG